MYAGLNHIRKEGKHMALTNIPNTLHVGDHIHCLDEIDAIGVRFHLRVRGIKTVRIGRMVLVVEVNA